MGNGSSGDKCPRCKGHGWLTDNNKPREPQDLDAHHQCRLCQGQGVVPNVRKIKKCKSCNTLGCLGSVGPCTLGDPSKVRDCPDCQGKGYVELNHVFTAKPSVYQPPKQRSQSVQGGAPALPAHLQGPYANNIYRQGTNYNNPGLAPPPGGLVRSSTNYNNAPPPGATGRLARSSTNYHAPAPAAGAGLARSHTNYNATNTNANNNNNFMARSQTMYNNNHNHHHSAPPTQKIQRSMTIHTNMHTQYNNNNAPPPPPVYQTHHSQRNPYTSAPPPNRPPPAYQFQAPAHHHPANMAQPMQAPPPVTHHTSQSNYQKYAAYSKWFSEMDASMRKANGCPASNQSAPSAPLAPVMPITAAPETTSPANEVGGVEMPTTPTDDDKECVVCLTEPPNHVIVPCGHLCLCEDCSKNLKKCPLCRAEIQMCMKVYS